MSSPLYDNQETAVEITKRIDMRPVGGVVFQVLRGDVVMWEDRLDFNGTFLDRDAGPRMRSYLAEMERQAKALTSFTALAGQVPH